MVKNLTGGKHLENELNVVCSAIRSVETQNGEMTGSG